MYKDIYYGKYLECINDSDAQDIFNNEGKGTLKEYLLLTDELIQVTKIN